MSGSDEAHLVRSVAEPLVFDELVGLHGQTVHGYLARRAGPVADDLNAEVWLAAFATRAAYDPARGAVRSWLLSIARNVLHTHYRRHGREPLTPAEAAGVVGIPQGTARSRLHRARQRLRERLPDHEQLMGLADERKTR